MEPVKHRRIRHSIQSACAMIMLSAIAAFGESSPTMGNPDTNASDRNYDTRQPDSVPGAAQKAKDAGNRGLNKVDDGVHTGIQKTKKAGRKAKKKTNEEMNKLSEPANKP